MRKDARYLSVEKAEAAIKEMDSPKFPTEGIEKIYYIKWAKDIFAEIEKTFNDHGKLICYQIKSLIRIRRGR